MRQQQGGLEQGLRIIEVGCSRHYNSDSPGGTLDRSDNKRSDHYKIVVRIQDVGRIDDKVIVTVPADVLWMIR